MAVEGMKCLYLFIAGNICNCLKLAGILSGRKMDINGKGKINTQDTRGRLKHTSKKGDYKNFRKRHGIKDKKHFVVQICTKSIMYT